MDRNLRASNQSPNKKIEPEERNSVFKKQTRSTINSKAFASSPRKLGGPHNTEGIQQIKNTSINFWSYLDVPDDHLSSEKGQEEVDEGQRGSIRIALSSQASISEESLSIVEEQYSPQNIDVDNDCDRKLVFECSIESMPHVSDDSEKKSEKRREKKGGKRRRNRSRLFCFIKKPEFERSISSSAKVLGRRRDCISGWTGAHLSFLRESYQLGGSHNTRGVSYARKPRSQGEIIERPPSRVEGIQKDMLDLRDFEFF